MSKAQRSGSPRVGVVLSSGGGRGVFGHTGFLLALQQMGIEVGAVAGSSAGALVGAMAASGTPLQDWARIIATVRTKEYWTADSMARFLWCMAVAKGRGYTGLSGTEAAIDFCRRHLAVERFEACPIPLHILAMNLSRGEKVWFTQGELAPRIMASAAMPVLYRPVEIDGEYYSDGALVEMNSQASLCCLHGLDALLVHHTAAHRGGAQGLRRALQQPWSMVEILYLLLYRERPWYLSERRLNLHRCTGCEAPLIAIEPELPELSWPLSEGGPRIQEVAKAQTLALLGPMQDALRDNPRRLLMGEP